jgi:hypothetical protein
VLFVETPIFTRLVTATLNDADYAAFQQSLADCPDAGRLIEGGAGIRKIRWAFYWRAAEDQIYLLYLFSKNARTDLTQAQVRQLAEAARALK